MAAFAIDFRPLAHADLPLVSAWVAAPHVARWWTDVSDLASVERKYGPRIDGTEPTEMFVIVVDGEPVGLIQRYRVKDHPDWLRTLRATGVVEGENAAGIDYLIGSTHMIGRGVGSRAVREFTVRLFRDYGDIGEVVVSPQQANMPSWRALESSSYERIWAGLLDSDDDSDAGPAYLYRRARETVPVD